MPSLEAGALRLHPIRLALFRLARRRSALLTEPDDFLLAIIARLDDMRLCRVVRRAARLVASHRGFVDPLVHFFLAARMLSTRFG